jgi:DNA-binding transcriptional ArsR family regulator
MSEMGLIAPPKQIKVSFALEPAYNALTSLFLLNSEFSGFSEWVDRTAAALPPDRLEANKTICNTAMLSLDSKSWTSFPAWLGDLAARDSVAMRDKELDMLLEKAVHVLGENQADLPSRETLASDRSAYLDLIRRLYEHKDEPFDETCCEADHARYQDPIAGQEQVVSHLRAMWDEYVADEWGRSLPTLRESIAAFESLDYTNKSVAEIFTLVTDRELPQKVAGAIQGVEELIFIPSPHIGPYVLVIDRSEKHARIMFGARIPQGATIRSPALSRSELVTRLSALADDTRLRILQLVAQEGEQRTQEIMTKLEISQSAASRHLPQLSATGYLAERRCEGAKCYRLNRDRLDDTFDALQRFLQ